MERLSPALTHALMPGTADIIFGPHSEVSKEFPASFGDNTNAGIGGACPDPIPINSRVYRATRFPLTRARVSFCCSDARFNTFE